MANPTTRIATSTADRIEVRGRSLADELIGHLDFTSMIVFQMVGRVPTAAERTVIDGVLVAIMEHGFTPSSLATRLTHLGAPESMQGAVAAGLLGAGSTFLGSMEQCARLLQDGVERLDAGADVEQLCDATIESHHAAGRRLPGFGHPVHRPVDPRTPALLALAESNRCSGAHVALLQQLSRAVDRHRGSPLPVNATGAIAAVLSDLGLPWGTVRGFALIARCAGLVGHVLEEQRSPVGPALWELAEQHFPYEPTDGLGAPAGEDS